MSNPLTRSQSRSRGASKVLEHSPYQGKPCRDSERTPKFLLKQTRVGLSWNCKRQTNPAQFVRRCDAVIEHREYVPLVRAPRPTHGTELERHSITVRSKYRINAKHRPEGALFP